MWNELRALVTGGSKAEPATVAAPVATPVPTEYRYTVHEDGKGITQTRVAPEPEASSLPAGAMPLFTKEGVLYGHLHEDGKFVVAVAVKPLDHLSEADRRPIDWDEEKRTDLPQRSSGRIQFLLQYETAAQTQDRIQNDIARYHFGGGDGRALRANPQGLQRNPEAATPGVSNWGN